MSFRARSADAASCADAVDAMLVKAAVAPAPPNAVANLIASCSFPSADMAINAPALALSSLEERWGMNFSTVCICEITSSWSFLCSSLNRCLRLYTFVA